MTAAFFPEGDTPIRTDDIIETLNHFKAVDYILENAREPLTRDFVKKLHRLLKQNTSHEHSELYSIGAYKKFSNQIGSLNIVQTTPAGQVEKDMTAYFEKYKAFKELLRIGGYAYIVRDENRAYYIRGLQEFENSAGYLTDTLLREQDYYKALVEKFGQA